MKILITGGAGFIGSHISDEYLKLGHDVTVIDNLSSGKKENINSKIKFFDFDINDSRTYDLINDSKFDIISHHAAQMNVRVSVDDPRFDAQNNIMGSLNIYEAAKSSKVKKIIFASSGGTVYGEQFNFPARESDKVRPCSPYGISKYTNEKYLFYYKEVYGLDYVSFRYGNVYGPRQNPHGEAGVVAIFANKMLNGGKAVINGDGLITRDYIYIDDVVNANRLALNSDVTGVFNITTGVETDVNTIFKTLKNVTNSNIEEFHGPAEAGEQRRSVCSYEKFKTLHGWEPKINFDEGIKLTVNYFKSFGN